MFNYLWPLFNFLVLLAVGIYYGKQPLTRILASHEEEVAETLEGAEENRSEAKQLLQKQKRQWQQIDKEIEEIRQEAERARKRLRRRMKQRAEREQEHLASRIDDTIRRERDEAVAEVRREIADALVFSVRRALIRLISPRDHEQIIEHLIDEMEDAS